MVKSAIFVLTICTRWLAWSVWRRDPPLPYDAFLIPNLGWVDMEPPVNFFFFFSSSPWFSMKPLPGSVPTWNLSVLAVCATEVRHPSVLQDLFSSVSTLILPFIFILLHQLPYSSLCPFCVCNYKSIYANLCLVIMNHLFPALSRTVHHNRYVNLF